MHRTPLHQITIFITIFASLMALTVSSQPKPFGEIDLAKCWVYPLGDETSEALASNGDRVFLGLGSAKVEALSLDGKKMWASELGGDINSNILAIESGLFLVSSAFSSDPGKPDGSVLRSLSKETGITNWTLKLPVADKHFLGGFSSSVIVISKSGVIQSIDAKSGMMKWKREIAEGIAAEPSFDGDKVIVATTARQILVISLISGEIDSMRKVPYGVTAIGEISTGEIIVG